MKISELPVAEKVNNEDVFPVVQDGETKKAQKNALQIPDDVGITDAGNLVLTVSGEKIGEGVPLQVDQTYSPESANAQSGVAVSEAVKKSGVRKIRRIELGTGETANSLKISTDEDGKPFELHEAFFTARFIFDASDTTSYLRIRSDGGSRYIVLKNGISLSNGIITCSGIINAHGGILSTSAVYSTTDHQMTADTIMYGKISKNANITHNLKDIEMLLYSSTFKELKEGSFLELWGC